MAEVEKPTVTPPTDIPLATPPSTSELESPTTDGAGADVEPGTSPTQEPNSNSHPHDSEYDTASDLEGGEDYDDEESGSGSASGSGSEEETETDEEDEGSETDDGEAEHAQDRSIADSEAQKKVDEDRSNPQYIPKRGTFYEHDDRTAETEGDVLVEPENGVGQTQPEPNGDLNGLAAAGAASAGQPPQISQASKTMRKWQPASGGDRWSHDRFEASEQAPKSRAELLQAYGYDIRNEDAPPRARRRRRYTRGPSKYSRNWEDEQAYLKASNKERKPPRPQDFPALNERKPRGPRASSSREEKENRRSGGAGGVGVEKQQSVASSSNPNRSQERERERERERDREREREPKNRNFGRMNGGPARQNAMEFKKSGRGQQPRDRERDREQLDNRNQKQSSAPRSNQQHPQQQPPHQQQQQQPQQQRQPPQQPQTPLSTTNLSQRLQQVQQRNDPSHVGSVQMHSLANQSPQQPTQPLHQEQRNAPKRYSSLRRSQQEASQHLAEQQQQQQMQQQLHLQQQQPQPSQIMIQDPHVLMQIAYQQQELQAQLQTMQLGPPTASGAVPAPVPKPHAPPATAYPQAQAAPYYVTGTEPVPVTVPVPVPVTVPVPQAPYVNPASAAYLPTTPSAVAYAQAAPPVVPQPTPAPAQAPPAAQPAQPYQNYNTVGGTTYFVPPAQTANRPAALPQRRPTNAIPILPPSEKHKTKGGGGKEEGISDNIDHIIDNMFVARPSAFQPTGEGAAAGGGGAGSKEDAATPPATEQNLQPVAATGKE